MYKHLPQYITDLLFPIIHERIKAKNRQARKLAEFKLRSKASKKGWDRRQRVIDRRVPRYSL